MMSGLRHPATKAFLTLLFSGSVLAPLAQAADNTRPAAETAQATMLAAQSVAPTEQFVDGIAAIVNKQVITLRQLADKQVQVSRQMQQQQIPMPEDAVFKRQVLQQMINDALQDQEAHQQGIRVSETQVDQAIQTVAQRNRLTVEQLQAEVQNSGMSWDRYRTELRAQIRDDMLRQRSVEERISISDSDIDAFLQTQADWSMPQSAQPETHAESVAAPSGPELIELAQILIEVPDYAANEVVAEKRRQAEDILRMLRTGADFAGLAASSSNGPQALQGGDMGIRPLQEWPDLFARAVADVPAGGVSGIVQSGRGFHILKVLRRGYAQPQAAAPQSAVAPAPVQPPPSGPMMVTQTHARHILIKSSAVMSDDKARGILDGLLQRIEHGESFAELAKRYSQDASAPQGGDLGWLNPGETVPAFEQAMNALQEGQISAPVQSPFGWHLIQVEGRRTKNMEQEYRRMLARRELMERRIGPAYEDWLDQLRSQAYIDNRLEPARSAMQ